MKILHISYRILSDKLATSYVTSNSKSKSIYLLRFKNIYVLRIWIYVKNIFKSNITASSCTSHNHSSHTKRKMGQQDFYFIVIKYEQLLQWYETPLL